MRLVCRGLPGKQARSCLGLPSRGDALPGIGHACGHNLFSNYSLLAAVALKAVIADLGGEIRVYGTPGEEGGERICQKVPTSRRVLPGC